MRKALLLGGLLATIYGCGGGGGLPVDDDFFIGGGGTSSSVEVVSLGVSQSSVGVGDTFTVNWQVDYSSPSGIYFVTAYINSSPTVPNSSDYLFYRNCGASPIYGCNSSGSISCTYSSKAFGEARFDCGTSSYGTSFSGNGYLVLEACVYDGSMQRRCDVRSVPLTVN